MKLFKQFFFSVFVLVSFFLITSIALGEQGTPGPALVTVTVSASPSSIQSGQTSYITWSSTPGYTGDGEDCSGGPNGGKSQDLGQPPGSFTTPQLTTTTTYTIYCRDPLADYCASSMNNPNPSECAGLNESQCTALNPDCGWSEDVGQGSATVSVPPTVSLSFSGLTVIDSHTYSASLGQTASGVVSHPDTTSCTVTSVPTTSNYDCQTATQFTNPFNFITPPFLSAGDYVFTATGTNATGNASDSKTIEVSGSAPLPDLTAYIGVDITGTVGQPVNLSALITNTGDAPTNYLGVNAFNNYFRLNSGPNGTGSSFSDLTPSLSLGVLSAQGNNDSATINLSHTFNGSAMYSVEACADESNHTNSGVIAESDEGNNCSDWVNIWISPVGPLPDLIAAPATVSPSGAINVGDPVTFSSLITNQGQTGTGTSFHNFFQVTNAVGPNNGGGGGGVSLISKPSFLSFLSSLFPKALATAPPTPVLIDLPATSMSALSNLSPNNTGTTSQTYQFLNSGTWWVRACADKSDRNTPYPGEVLESNEVNNCATWVPVTVGGGAQKPDLTASAISSSSQNITVGVPVTFSATITNGGPVSTLIGFTNKVQGSTNGGQTAFTIGTAPMTALAGNTSAQISETYTFTNAGTFSVRACADLPPDPFGVIDESIESNNCGPIWSTFTVTGGSIGVSLSANPVTIVLPADSTTLYWTTTGSPTACTAAGEWSGSKSPAGGNEVISGLTLGTHTFKITCTKLGLPNAMDSISVNVVDKTQPVDGVCDTTHWNCLAGTSANNGSNTTEWTWDCDGVNGGQNVSCTETMINSQSCEDPNASNYGGPLPCVYPNNTACEDPTALNYGSPLPCLYSPGLCLDSSATNYGGSLPCTYVIVDTNSCEDSTALNYGSPLPCLYKPGLCLDSSARNYGGKLPCVYKKVLKYIEK